MEKELGKERAVALRHYAQAVLQTREQAMEVLDTIWPDAPMAAKAKAALICIQYELNPLMKHVYLIKFESKKTGKITWEPVLGIQANRLIAHRAGEFSYIDNTPRVMTKEEQQKIFAEVMEDRVWAITKVRDRNGNEASGYGFWLKGEIPYGQDKGNTKQNMAFIRSERQALDRLFAGKIPDVEVVDERFVTSTTAREVNLATGEITGPEDEEEPIEAVGLPVEEKEPEPRTVTFKTWGDVATAAARLGVNASEVFARARVKTWADFKDFDTAWVIVDELVREKKQNPSLL